MNDELDKLRPEVQPAFSRLNQDVHLSPQSFMDWTIIRAELVRLAEDAAMFAHAVSLGQRYKQRAEHAEAELAALKARMDK